MAPSRTSTRKEDKPQRRSLSSAASENTELRRQLSQKSWIEKTFLKRECCKYIPSSRDHSKCCCGRSEQWHVGLSKKRSESCRDTSERWHPMKHSETHPTDAYGTIEFQGAPHPSKAQYIRLSSFDSRPEQVVQMMTRHWGLDLPKLLITVHGGLLNFDIQPKLKRVFRKGLLKAARTTGAWIFTNGTNTGVTKHVGDAISDRTAKTKNKVVAVGIAPWGIVERKEDLIGRDVVVPYHCVTSTKINSSVLNSNHSYFLLADNGTVGKYGGEIIFRRKLEKFIAQQKICITDDFKGRGVPVICVVLEGGANTIRAVLEYVTDNPPVPVVICDGSGRAADLLAFAHKYTLDDGTMPESLRDQLIMTIKNIFQYTKEQAEKLFIELMLCVKKKELITVFRMSEGSQDIDLAILTALLKGTNASAMDQLNLVLAWNRVDIARSHIFVYGQEWPEGGLEQAMMDALISDRVDFVKLLLENGVSMHKFLTIDRLEELYNTKQGPSNTLKYLIKDVRKNISSHYRYTLLDIGLIIQHLMGGAFRSSYCRRYFRQKYFTFKQRTGTLTGMVSNLSMPNFLQQVTSNPRTNQDFVFEYPFHDLMVWAVLMKRQRMALFMWQHGEEAMAKALLACTLYRALAHEADQDDLEIELSQEFRSYSSEFQTLALELLEHCYKIDDDYTQQLLTYEIKTFSEQTNLGLAVGANHRQFIAHTACQVLLNDLWIGGLRMRKNTSLKVILGLLLPPYLLALEFKSREELQLMPQTMEEHLDDLEEGGEVQSQRRLSVSSFDESQVNEEYNKTKTADLELMSGGGGEDTGGGENIMAMNVLPGSQKNENGNLSAMDGSIQSPGMAGSSTVKRRKSQLRMGKKIYEFYNAPVTKFWMHTLAYVTFLCIFTYMVLARIRPLPEWQEVYVIAYIATLFMEKIRQVIAQEPVKLSMKIRVFLSRIWNAWDLVSIALFAVGVVLRCFPGYLKDAYLIYTVDLILWKIRILEIMSVNQYLGPYVKIIGKLIRDMAYYLIILFIVVTSFGVARQAVSFQNQNVTMTRALRNVWFYPYWMIYGELFAETIDPCEENEGSCDVYGSWLSPALMCIYLLIANILGVNLLIARFNATFIRNNAYSREIWMFQRYQLIIEYEMRPIFPPPFIIITHLFLALKYICRRCKGKRDYFDNGLKLFLSREDTEKLHDFEEECMEDFFREKENKFHSSSDERVRLTTERVETMLLRLEDINTKESSMRLSMQTIDYRLGRLEEVAANTNETLQLLRALVARQNTPPPTSGGSGQPPTRSYSTGQTNLIPGFSLDNVSDDGQGQGRASSPAHSLSNWRADSLAASIAADERELKCLPSPMLVHSQRPTRQDHIRRFTSFTLATRQLSGENFSVTSLEEAEGSRDQQDTVGQLSVGPQDMQPLRVTVSDSSCSPNRREQDTGDHASLQERRSGSIRLSLDVGKAQTRMRSRSMQSGSVHLHHEPSVHTADPRVASAGLLAAVQISNSAAQQLAELDISTGQQQHLNIVQGHPASTPIDPDLLPLTPSVRPHVIASTDIFVTPDTASASMSPSTAMIPASAVRDLCSVFVPHFEEYYTVTDNIDVSCFRNLSPPRSPVPAATSATSPRAAHRKRTDSISTKVKEEELMEAEETERLKMEGLIRNRLRQISQDDSSGSISDMARLVVSDMETSHPATPPEEVDSDNDSSGTPKINNDDTPKADDSDADDAPINFKA